MLTLFIEVCLGALLLLATIAGVRAVVLNAAGRLITAYPSSMFGPGVLEAMSQLSIAP
jgi:hypothetical protein